MKKFAFLTLLFTSLIISGIVFFSSTKTIYADDIWKKFKYVKTLSFGQSADLWVTGADKIEIQYTSDKAATIGVRQNLKFPGYAVELPQASTRQRALIFSDFSRDGVTHFRIQNNSFSTLNIQAIRLYGTAPAKIRDRIAKKMPLLVAYGDSITLGFHSGGPLSTAKGYVDLIAANKGWTSNNLSLGGQSATCWGQANSQKIIEAKPTAGVIIGFGTNDMTGDYFGCKGTIDDFRSAMNKILADVRAVYPTIPLYVQAIVPRKIFSAEEIASWNAVLQEVSASHSATLIDPSAILDLDLDYFDNLHPNSQGHQKMADFWLGNI